MAKGIEQRARVFNHIANVIVSILFLFPFPWMLLSSFKELEQIYDKPLSILPSPWTLDPWIRLFSEGNFVRYFCNTAFVTVMTIIVTMISSLVVAFGFSYFRFKGRDAMFKVLLGTMMLPTLATLIPQYQLFDALKWVGTYKPLIVPMCFGGTWVIFLLRQFNDGVPRDYAESATLDGAGEFTILRKIYAPMSKAPISTACLFVFIWTWTDFIAPLIYLQSDDKYTLSIALQRMASGDHFSIDQPILMAGSVFMALPVIILFIAAQKTFIEGASLSGIKG
jgi:multiple sugar transport system permease protein